jgi:hypothetical protein
MSRPSMALEHLCNKQITHSNYFRLSKLWPAPILQACLLDQISLADGGHGGRYARECNSY